MGAPLQTQERWKDLEDLPMVGVPWAERRAAVQRELNVEMSPRYAPDSNLTWCNIYLTDFIRLMGIPAPRHWMTSGGAPAAVGKGIEMTANGLLTWFEDKGATYGWMKADAKTAQDAAERGHFVAVGWRNPSRGPGHVAVVLGRDRISQAGRTNHFVCTVRMGFGDPKPLEWYVLMDRPGGHAHV